MKDKEKFLQKTIVVWAGALICCLLWGSAFPGIKLGYAWMNIEAGDSAAQILYAGIRFTIAGIIAVLIGSILQREFLLPRPAIIPKVLGLSMFQTVLQYVFFYIGLAHASGVNSSIVEGVNVFVAVLVAGCMFHQEKVTWRKMLGCLIGFVGVVIVALNGGSLGSFSWNGEGFIFLSTVAYAFSSAFLKKISKDENPVMLSGWQFIFGGLIMILFGLLLGGHLSGFSLKAVGILIWLSFVSAGAYSLWSILLKYNPVSRVVVFGFMNPVFGVILSAIFLNEGANIGIASIAALACVCVGIYICNSTGRKKSER